MIGDCPKCGDRMVALFQTPKCERCELGGKETSVPTVLYGTVHAEHFSRKGCGFGAVFAKESVARRFAEFIEKDRGFVVQVLRLRLAQCSTGVIVWEPGVWAGIEGEQCFDTAIYASEELAVKNEWNTKIRMVIAA